MLHSVVYCRLVFNELGVSTTVHAILTHRNLDVALRVDHGATFGISLRDLKSVLLVLGSVCTESVGLLMLRHRGFALVDKLHLIVNCCALEVPLLRPSLLDSVPARRQIYLIVVWGKVPLSVVDEHVLVVRTHILERFVVKVGAISKVLATHA